MLNLEKYEVADGLENVNSAATNSTTLHIRRPLTTIDKDEPILFYLFFFGAVSLVCESSYLKQINNIN
jgi:hypothetical protein